MMLSTSRPALLGFAIATAGVALIVFAERPVPRHAEETLSFQVAETARIRSHLARVERELRGRDVSCLDLAQRRARARNLVALHAYWVRGVFPHNHDFPNRRVPYFVDRHGTLCAMAYLIERSGAGDLVHRVAASYNNARIRELAADQELESWLDRNGLTVGEAARIQPDYVGEPASEGAGAAVYAGLLGAIEIPALACNVHASDEWSARRARGVYGFVAGSAGMIVSSIGLMNSNETVKTIGGIGLGLGALTTGLAMRNLGKPTPVTKAERAPVTHELCRNGPYLRRSPEGEYQIAIRLGF